jgi:DNA-binding transcriptional MerR regulator
VQSTAKATGQAGKQEIPDKLYFRIGDVSRLAGLKPYVLRYWETEFSAISPRKSGTGHRLYRRKDVELILEIKHLLYEKRFTIEGARKALENRGKSSTKRTAAKAAQAPLFAQRAAGDFTAIRRELEDILKILG